MKTNVTAVNSKPSLLAALPSAIEVRQRINSNAAENRLLRSLYQLVRRVEDRLEREEASNDD